MTDIISPIPFEISNFGTESGGSYSLRDYKFDYALGGIPFLSATRDQWPYTEGMAEIRKQQFDSFAEPGEQSLYGWWHRSQSTFNAGAGLLYQDPDSDNQFNYRFADSLGVDPWTSGQLSLLREMSTRSVTVTSTATYVAGYIKASGADAAYLVDGGNLWDITESTNAGVSFGSVGSAMGIATAGRRGLISMTDGMWMTVDGAAATKIFTYPSTPSLSAPVAYLKNRVMTGVDGKLFINPLNTGATVAIDSTDIFTLDLGADPGWSWTSFAEGPNALYASGRNTVQSHIYKIVPSIDNAGVETFTAAITASMPLGETINSIYGYVGSFLAIATNKGFRVGEIDSNGDVVYGPLLFQPSGGCTGIVGYDRFLYVGSTNAHDSQSGVFRVDLGNVIQEQTSRTVRYAYSRDAYASGRSAAIRSVSMFGGSNRLIWTMSQDSLQLQSASTLVPSGYLKTGRIRFNTEEPKLYKFVSLRTPATLDGNVQLSLISEQGSEIPYVTYGPGFSPNVGDVGTPTPAGRQNWIILKFTLSRGTDTTKGGVLNGWQVKALPGSIRQRLISHTFLLFDEEMDKAGQRVGGDGYARERFEDFKELAREGDVVVFQELIENTSTLVVIDDWKYTQLAPPGSNATTLGGYLTVVLRTVAES